MTDPQIELSRINHRLTEIEDEKDSLLHQRKQLEAQIAITTNSPTNTSASSPLSATQKIQIFKKLFRGRDDIFATRWENAKGRNGYSLACNNEWKPGICNKPKIKCGECTHKAFKQLDDQIVYDHLAGKLTIGLYPLLSDNTCHLLAADFDKDGWQESVKAMSKVCGHFNIPHAIEISRSGNGAHLWLFFSEPIPAKEARILGFGLLDKAMEIHPSISFDSYDRLFPNQDFMPDGGFGNLIALPLQYQARQQGNSLFVNNNLQPFPDQWHFLSEIKLLTLLEINKLLRQIAPQDRQRRNDHPPWEQGITIKNDKIDDCPRHVRLTLANHIYLLLDELPPLLITKLKRIASFSNPVFFKTQAMRFSTHSIPRYISCAHIEQGYLSLPRGCLDDAIKLLEEQNIDILIEDKRQQGKQLKSIKFLGQLRKTQIKAVKIMARHDTGVLHAPTAFGKTVTAIALISKRKVNTLILTHSRQLLDQWQERLKSLLADTDIGVIRGGKRKPTGQIDVATYQSLINEKDNSVDPQIQEYAQIIIDECHHISAPRFEMVLNEVRAKYVFGLTATPDRQDGHQKIIFMLSGPIRHKIKSDHADKFELEVRVTQLYQKPSPELINPNQRPHIADTYRWLTKDYERTQMIVNQVIKEIEQGRHPLVLSERREHAELIHQMLTEHNIHAVILRGAMRAKERATANAQLDEAQVIVATGKYIGEGFDLPRLDTLFLALPIAWKGSLAQYAGRIHRESEGKDRVTIYDYVDASLPMLERMFRKREKGYKAMGYRVNFIDQ